MMHNLVALLILTLGIETFAETKADNTKINERDRKSSELTADQQNYKKSDTEMIRRIRQDIMKQNELSTYAKNIKVIAANGIATLKGPVRSAEEIKNILFLAEQAAGESNVVNEMSVVPDNK